MIARSSTTDRLRFTWAEFSGSLGDLGLFLPLVVAMTALGGLDMGTILIAAGAMNVATGLVFRQPIPVQPMKAIAAVSITEGLTRGEVMAAGLVMGALLLALALAGVVDAIDRVIPRPLVRGIQLGVGLKLVLTGAGWIADLPVAGWNSISVAILTAIVLLGFLAKNKPGLLLIFLAGFVLLYVGAPATYEGVGLSWPVLHLGWPGASEWKAGLFRGALPQFPLTMLNSVIAVCALSADYFPGRGITPRRMAASVGVMNLLCTPFGAVPMCHGAGGLAAQHRFGARTGGSVVMLGAVKIAAGIVFGSALLGILGAYPLAILGPMLIFAGVELARSCADVTESKALSVVLLTAAGILGVNASVGFLAGSGLYLAYWIWNRATSAA